MPTVKPSYNAGHKPVLDELFAGWPGVTAGKMFGYPAYYVNKKLFACLYGEGIGIKVPSELAEALLRKKNIVPFQPLGKARMKEWVQINRKRSADYRKDTELFRASVSFVGTSCKD
jgi:hypothetical protein